MLIKEHEESLLKKAQQINFPQVPKMETDILNIMKEPYIPHSYMNQYPEKTVSNMPVNTISNSFYKGTSNSSMESFTMTSYSTSVENDDDFDFGGPQNRSCCGLCYKPPQAQNEIKNTNSESDVSYSSTEHNLTSALLGPPSPSDYGKICLVIDLDETLVHSSFVLLEKYDFSFPFLLDSTPTTVYVNFRPGALEFIQKIAPIFEVVFFTASCKEYADPVLDKLDEGKLVKYRLYRENCTELGGNFVKDISRMNRDLDKIIIIDNSPTAYMLQPGNAIAISSWFDDQKDKELFVIMQFLTQNSNAKNVYNLFGQE